MLALAGLAAAPVWAQPVGGVADMSVGAAGERSVDQWLERLHEASRRYAYSGTFIVSAGAEIAASKIWHVHDGHRQFERIEALTGAPRTTLRRDEEVITLVPETRTALWEKREALRPFPALLKVPGLEYARLYMVRSRGLQRVAGFEADVVDFLPRDRWRFGYRLWSEHQTGLVLKLQTRDAAGQVLEQATFTELKFDAPLSKDKLLRQMVPPSGYQVLKPVQRKTTPEAEGWRLKALPPGFQPVTCHSRGDAAQRLPSLLQCVFSDGLASVSWFAEPFDPARHVREQSAASGATHYLNRRLDERWITVMGEVPTETLRQFATALEPAR